jgi:hypothetical protein
VTGRQALAVLRALPAAELPDAIRDEAAVSAAGAGRRLVPLGEGRYALGWADGQTRDPVDERFESRVFADGRLKVLACLLHCCWPQPDQPLWPGRPAALAELDRVFGGLDIDRRHAIGALRGDLRAAGLCEGPDHGPFRLGPAVAAWGADEVREARRAADLVGEVAGA